jgi:hypothetical protein
VAALLFPGAVADALAGGNAAGDADPAALCLRAADAAAARMDVPRRVMRALTLTETGRPTQGRLRPWPWTVNMQGEGRWFDSRDAALAFALDRRAAGARSFDIGCFQINYLWHGRAFASVEAMFDPMANAAYAARFLRRLYAETGSWSRAAGAYHSRTPALAARYRTRFDRIFARLETGGPANAWPPAGARPAGAAPPAGDPAPVAGPKRVVVADLSGGAGGLGASSAPSAGAWRGAAPGGVALAGLRRPKSAFFAPPRRALRGAGR